jgi:hypothetical protein
MIRNISISSLFIVFLIIACNKKGTTVKPDPRTLLTAHAWKINALLYRMQGDAVNDDFTNYVYKDCESDDTYTFGTDSTFIRNDNVITCSIPVYFGPYGEGNWSGNNDLTQLTIKTAYYSATFTVDELTTNSLIIEQATKNVFQNDIVYTYEFESAP